MKLSPTIFSMILIVSSSTFASTNRDHVNFSALDTNNDGVLSKKEVMAQPATIRFTNLYYEGSFSLADINRDGLIDLQEYLANEEDTY